METDNVFQILIDLKKKLLAILFVRQKDLNREEPVARVEIEEVFRIVKFSTSSRYEPPVYSVRSRMPRNGVRNTENTRHQTGQSAGVRQTCIFHTWVLSHIRRFLLHDVANTIACITVGAHIDYCNSLSQLTCSPSLSRSHVCSRYRCSISSSMQTSPIPVFTIISCCSFRPITSFVI